MKQRIKRHPNLKAKAILFEIENSILTTNLPEIDMNLEDAILEIELIKIEQKAIAHQARLYRTHVRKLEGRLLTLYKRRSAIEASITVGVTKIAPAAPSEPKRKKTIKEDGAEAFVESLSQKEINELIKEIEKSETKGGEKNGKP